MSDLIANWLNNEIELSKTVTNFEGDFANGYLFGELLFKFNQQSNFKEFSKKDSVKAKLLNFKMLEETFRNLKIKFNSQMVDQVMKEQRGVSLRLLYQLKQILEKQYPPTDIAVLRKTGKMGDNQPALKIAPQREQFDSHAHVFFENRLQAMNKPQKVLDMEARLSKFKEEKVKQEMSARSYHLEQQDAKDKVKQEIRRAQINKLQRNAGFMEEWQQKGVEDWKKNQTIKKERERSDLEFEYNQAQKYKNLTVRKIDEATNEVNDGIAQFEQTLKNKGIQPKVSKEEAERAISDQLSGSPLKSTKKIQRLSQSLYGRGPQATGAGTMLAGSAMQTKMGGMTLASTGLKSKDKKTVDEKTRKDREKRRRKMIVDQGKTHSEMEQKARESQIVERIKRQAKQEEELAYEQWRTNQCKNVIIENRKLREARYDKRRELDQQTANWREEEMLNSMKDQMTREMKTLQERDEEMRIAQKQAQRQKKNDYANTLFDAIFEISNEAFILQQKSDKEEIDSRNWHEWMQLFIEELPIEGTLQSLAEQDTDKQEQEEYEDAANPHVKLDQIEISDYLTNKAQWPTDLVTSNKPNLEHVITGQVDIPAPTGGAKQGKAAPSKAAAAEQVPLEEGDTELFDFAPNNYLLGDAIENIINLNYEERPAYKRPKVPHFLNLKLCLVGCSFSGKKTQAQKLMDEYGLTVYHLDNLVQEALTFSKEHVEPIKHQSSSHEAEEFCDDVSEESEESEDYNCQEDFRKCGTAIQDLLAQGEDISDELYVQLFIAKLRCSNTHKTKRMLRQELKIKVEKQLVFQKQLDAIQQELNGEETEEAAKKKKKKNPAQLEEESQQIKAELDQLNCPEKNGWVLVDFPSTFAQAKLLETALSGYCPSSELEPVNREQLVNEALLLVQPQSKERFQNKLIQSGIDAVIWFDVERQESLRRALGRRFDNFNENVYHVEDAPPLTTSAPLCERLVPVDQPENCEATLIDKWIAFDQTSKGLQNWLKQFGEEESNYCILNKINANSPKEEMFLQLKTIVDKVLQLKQQKESVTKERLIIKIKEAEAEEQEKLRVQAELEEERKKLEEANEEEGNPDQLKQDEKVENKVQKPDPVGEKIGPKEPALENIDSDFRPVILKLWEELSSNYKRQVKKIFRHSRAQRERMTQKFSYLQDKYLQFLHRPDAKQEKLEQFIQEFNDFSDQSPDLREDDQTKEELHQRVDILTDQMWEMIEDRKDQNVEERKKIMESGMIEYELSFALNCSQLLMQAEVDKFKQCVQIIHDYYHAYEDKLLPEAPQQYTIELVAEGEELPPVEVLPEGADPQNVSLYQYPRLEKLFERALKAQVVPDVTLIQPSAQDKKGAPAKGKDAKKQVQEEEKPQEESPYVKMMKEAIKKEKAILRYRLTLLRNWTQKGLREMRANCMEVYQKLNDWILVAQKTENDAVEEMSKVVKAAIEEETKLQDELRIKFMDFCVDEKIMNFIVPPPQKLLAMEQVRPDRFNIKQLTCLFQDLKEIAAQQAGGTTIPNRLVIDLFLRKLENSRSLGDESSLPEDWLGFGEQDFQTIVRNLDKYNQGNISWKQLAIIIALLQSPIVSEKDADCYCQQLGTKDGYVDLKTFIQASAWFDSEEESVDRDYSIPYPRVEHLKELLFQINKEEKNGEVMLNVKKLMMTLKAKELTMFKRSMKKYADVLFAPIEK